MAGMTKDRYELQIRSNIMEGGMQIDSRYQWIKLY